MATTPWPRKTRATLNWQHLSAPEADAGKPWAVIWDTTRKPGTDGRNTALESNERAALDRAKHILRMGFLVYELRDSTGALFLDEGGVRDRLGLKPDAPAAPEATATPTLTAIPVGESEDEFVAAVRPDGAIANDDLARDMIKAHGNGAAGVARGNAQTAALAGLTEQVRQWLAVVAVIQRRAEA
jgi:hypothetical protein